MNKLLSISLAFVLIYTSFEGAAQLSDDAGKTENSLLICAVVLVISLLIEQLIFKRSFKEAIKFLGLGFPQFHP
jgi:hypothetical protein